ncbi:TolC family protein [candidate division KSB1 bacterium]|nr:TolC family protein [candidate division KSB1 bacterium]
MLHYHGVSNWIQKENLKRTRSNLELAEIREQIGSSSRAEVFRWESEVAIDRKDVITANAQRNLAEITLNTILHRPAEEKFILLETDLDDATAISSREKIRKYLDDAISFKILRSFVVVIAMENSPDILALDAAISAKESELRLYKRSFWSPTFALVADYSTILKKGGAGTEGGAGIGIAIPEVDDNTWSIGLNASLPIFEGTGKFAQQAQAHKELESLKLQRRSVVEKVEQRVRSAMHLAGASRAGIKLSKDAAEAAQKNLELVTDAYSRGVTNILDLLDAQNAALTADLAAANAVYDHMLDFMEVERAIGKFSLTDPDSEHEKFLRRLDDYFEKAGVQP